MSPEEWMREEIRRLRDWKHGVDKSLQAVDLLREGLESLVGSQAAIERRLTKVEEDMRSMATADEIARGVTSAMKEQRGGILTRRQRIVGYAVALAAVVGVVIQIAHYFH